MSNEVDGIINNADKLQFRFLKRLLLVHGHWSYARNGNMYVDLFSDTEKGLDICPTGFLISSTRTLFVSVFYGGSKSMLLGVLTSEF